MVMARRILLCGLLLLCEAGSYGEDTADAFFADKLRETLRALAGVDQQLVAAQQVVKLFEMEDTQLQLFTLETRTELVAMQKEVTKEMEMVLQEVDRMRKEAVENVATWKKTLQGLEEATQRNEQMLQRIRAKKAQQMQANLKLQNELVMEDKRELEILEELERLRELEKYLEDGELKKLQELEQQDNEKKQVLKTLQALEAKQLLQNHEIIRNLRPTTQSKPENVQDVMQKANTRDFSPSRGAQKRSNFAKQVIDWYISKEQMALGAAIPVFQHLILPIVVILGLSFILTVLIAKSKAMKRARRSQRILYSGYPNTYRPKSEAAANVRKCR